MLYADTNQKIGIRRSKVDNFRVGFLHKYDNKILVQQTPLYFSRFLKLTLHADRV